MMPPRPVPSARPVPATSVDTAAGRSFAGNLFVSLRPHQWTKNVLVFGGLIFAKLLFDQHAVVTAIAAFAIFCALSSVVYLVNDLHDREADRLHPTKARRPIASGALSPMAATIAAVVLGVGAIAGAARINTQFLAVCGIYLVLLTAYSMWLKHVVILDVL